MRVSKRVYKAIEKKLNIAIRKYQRNYTIALNQEIKELENALAKASVKFIQKKEVANKAINKQEDTYVLIALLSQPIQEVININKDELDNKDKLDDKEYNEEVEFNEYIEGII